MKIVVLCGGVSTERDVSLRSSSKVATALQGRGHQVEMVDLFFGEETLPDFSAKRDFKKKEDLLKEKDSLITPELIESTGLFGPRVIEICKQADIVFLGLHGKNGEDGKVQAAFDKMRIRYTGSGPEASAIAMSKAQTKEIVAPHIRMPKGVALKRGHEQNQIKAPCVIKPSNGGSSIGVMLVMKNEDYAAMLEEAFFFDDTVLIEEYIKGRELTQAVLDGKPLPPVEICPDEDTWYDYANKYNGKTKEVCPADLPEDILAQMSESSVRFGELLGLSVYYRIDYLLDDEGQLFALEANSLPGMTDTSLVPQEAAAVGMDYPALCETIIEKSLEKYR